MNHFLFDDSKSFKANFLATTCIIEAKNLTAGYFSLLNDKVSMSDIESNRKWKLSFSDLMPKGKTFRGYPAVKIGRLAVDVRLKGNGLGSVMIQYVKEILLRNQKSGCKFITVDAYRDSLKFFEKNGFEYLTLHDEDGNTRLMYFDLATLN